MSAACTIPRMGPEYDSLIKVETIAKNKFRAIVAKKAGDLNFGAEIKVGYYPRGNERRYGEYWKPIYNRVQGDDYVVTFDLKIIEGYVPYLQVYWFPEYNGLCGAYGLSKDLHLE